MVGGTAYIQQNAKAFSGQREGLVFKHQQLALLYEAHSNPEFTRKVAVAMR